MAKEAIPNTWESIMGYLPGTKFKTDVFISYTHIDNKRPSEAQKGWVDQFEHDLSLRLKQILSKRVEVWRDREVQPNQPFNRVTKQIINESAVFLAITSPNYISESRYCKEEREYFYEKARGDGFGLIINERYYRILNVLLYNIPNTEWPPEFGKQDNSNTGFKFYELSAPESSDDIGKPVSPDSELYEKKMDQLGNAIRSMLVAFKLEIENQESSKPPEDADADEFKIFFADVPESLRKTKRLAVSRLTQEKIQVLETIPPPYPAEEHDSAVIEQIKKAGLTVHLLDAKRGEEIEDLPDKSYPQRQVELAFDHAKSQFIWVPKSFKIEQAEKTHDYQLFLQDLAQNPAEGSTLELIRSQPSDVIRLILEKVERIRRGDEQKSVQSDPSAILVDSHVQDEDSTFELGNFLQEKGVLPHLMFQQEQTPEQKLKYYERILHKVAKLIIFFGSVQADWVSERLITVQKLMAKNNYPPHICGIYLAPPPKRPGDINFIINFLQEYEAKPPTLKLKLIDNSEGFDPENLREILEYKPA